MNSCVHRRKYQVVLPSEDEIKTQQFNPEVLGQPDFYIRQKCGYLFIIECKGIRLNGELKDKANLSNLIDEIKNKLYKVKLQKNSCRKKNTPIGIGQLVNVIDGIQHYECTFDNVDDIPDEVIYYPMIALEDYKLAKSIGLTSMINRWYNDLMHEKGFTEGYNPIIIVSIDILMKYGANIKKFGLKRILDKFINASCTWNSDHSQWIMSPLADFNQYMESQYSMSQIINKKY